jgi:glycerophosphoryl diester phosphodiesterase
MMYVPLLLGHRGDRLAAPENTLSAFDLAMTNGCDGVEFDVRLSADSQAIIVHDPDVSGTSVALNSFGTLASLNPQLRGNDRIPRLEDVISRYAASAFLDIELKVPGLESAVVAQVKGNPPRCGYVVSSFLPEVLDTLSRQDPTIPLGFICEDPKMLLRWREMPVDYVIPKYDLVAARLVNEVHDAGRKILVWTVNDTSTMIHLAEMQVDGIISDDSRLMVQTLRRRN